LIDRFLAFGAVLCVSTAAYFIGRFVLTPVMDLTGSKALRSLSSLIIGVGLIGIVTAIAGSVIGYSPHVFKGAYIVLTLSIVLYLAVKKHKFEQGLVWEIKPYLEFPVILILIAAVYHFICYILTGFSYTIGSDAFSYVYIAQKYLALGKFAPMTLEPLGEILPIFKIPCLIEMVYINLLSISNLIAINLFAKMQLVVALLTVFFVAKKMGGQLAGWLTIAIFLTEPSIAYSAGESADNYFLAVSLLILCIYYLWLFYQSRKSVLLIYAGIFAGMMVSVKLTTCYYLFAFIIAVPFIAQKFYFQNKIKESGVWNGLMTSLYFYVPALVIGSIFPIIVYLKTSTQVMGLDWVLTDLTNGHPNSWIYPFYKIAYNNFVRYNDLFVKHPNLPYSIAGTLRVLSFYLVSPLKLHFGGNLNIFSHSPVAFLVGVIAPFFIAFSKKVDYFFRWLACVLLFAYGVKLLNYPLLEPPKSEIFQLLPTAIIFSYFISKVKYLWRGKVRNNKSVFKIIMVLLLPIIYINTFRIWPQYHNLIKHYSFAKQEKISEAFEQKWYIDNLTEKDILLGLHPNQLCYIKKPKVIPFFWESMHFVPWEIIEKRIVDLKVSVIYDSSYFPDKARDRYIEILPIVKKRDKTLYRRIENYLLMYEKNYTLKEEFLHKNYKEVASDYAGKIYVIK
jgi:4-amino-4-deoxy-L-arabinose transferase-like glycosyltransferase